MPTQLTTKAFRLLTALEANNNRDWFSEHKAHFETELLTPFEAMLLEASRQLSRTRAPLVGSRKTMFRLNRDTRFSANKLPYKLNVGGVLTRNGTKKDSSGLAYLHCEANGGFVAAGFYLPETRQLERIRQRMLDDSRTWRAVLRGLNKAGLSLDQEHCLKSMPRGFSGARDHEHAEFLKLKSLIIRRRLGKSAWKQDGAAVESLVSIARDASHLLNFGREAI